jgi:thiamine pyrophosphokinase
MNVVILANGEAPSKALLDRIVSECDCFIAVDGAAHAAARLGVTPQVICGDFDSVNVSRARKEFPGTEFVETEDQCLGDLEKAVRLAIDRGASSIRIVGAGGGRVDHFIGNLTLLLRYQSGIALSMLDEISETRCLSAGANDIDTWQVDAMVHDLVSVFSFDGAARATITGVRWPLHDAALPVGTLGLSNVVTSDVVKVTISGGSAFVCHTHLCSQAGRVADE